MTDLNNPTTSAATDLAKDMGKGFAINAASAAGMIVGAALFSKANQKLQERRARKAEQTETDDE